MEVFFYLFFYFRNMHKIFHPFPFENEISISESESKHLCRVMRLTEGSQVLLLDGNGSKALAEITLAHQKKTQLKIIEIDKIEKRGNFNLTIAIAPTKNIDRFEWFLEKSSELGIDRIVPLLCERSERKIIKQDRLNKILISAIKQSGQYFLPKLEALTTLQEFVKNDKTGFIAHCETGVETPPFTEVIKRQTDINILIGPEGDFTSKEISFAKANDYNEVTFGKSILRTETAGVYCSAITNALL